MQKLTIYVGAGEHNIKFMERWLTRQCSGFTSIEAQGHWMDSEDIEWTEASRMFVFMLETPVEVLDTLGKVHDYLKENTEEQCVLWECSEVNGSFMDINRSKRVESLKGVTGWIVEDWL